MSWIICKDCDYEWFHRDGVDIHAELIPDYLNKYDARIAELNAFIGKLIEAGDDVALVAKDILEFDGKSGEFTPIAEKWQALVKDWKER